MEPPYLIYKCRLCEQNFRIDTYEWKHGENFFGAADLLLRARNEVSMTTFAHPNCNRDPRLVGLGDLIGARA